MSDERSRAREELNADLSARLGAAISAYAEEHGLTKEEVLQAARGLLLNPDSPQDES